MKRRSFLQGLLSLPAITAVPTLAKAEPKAEPIKEEIELIDFGNVGIHFIAVMGMSYKVYAREKVMNYDTIKYETKVTNWNNMLALNCDEDGWHTQPHGILKDPRIFVPVNEQTEIIIKFKDGTVEQYKPKWLGDKFEDRLYTSLDTSGAIIHNGYGIKKSMKRRDFIKGLIAIPALPYVPSLVAKDARFAGEPIASVYSNNLEIELVGAYQTLPLGTNIYWSLIQDEEVVHFGNINNVYADKIIRTNIYGDSTVRIITDGVMYQSLDIKYGTNKIILAGIGDNMV